MIWIENSLASALQLLYRLARGLTTSRDILSDIRRLDGVTTLLIALDRCEGRCSYLVDSVAASTPTREATRSTPHSKGSSSEVVESTKSPLTPKRHAAGLPKLIQTTSPERVGGEEDKETASAPTIGGGGLRSKASPWTIELLARYRHPMCCICDVLSELAMDDVLSKQICVGNGVYLLGRILTFGDFYEPGT